MEAILKFDFNGENNDRIEFQDAVNGTRWRLAMWELDQWLRSQTKYAPDSMSDDTYKALDSCRDKLHEILMSDNLDLDS
jgi:hypothetical protein